MSDYNSEVFEPIEDTPVESPQIETPQNETPIQPDPEVEHPEATDSPESVDTPVGQEVDNDTVRYQYWQSEAAKAKKQLEELQGKLKPEPSKDEPPVYPGDNADPLEIMNYNVKYNAYLGKQINQLNQARQQDVETRRQSEEQQAVRQYTVAKLTEVTKSPQKSQNIVNFFAGSPHLQDPKVYDVMYDAAMNFVSGKSQKPSSIKSPPPPIGGSAVVEKTTPDDAFNEQLQERKTFRL